MSFFAELKRRNVIRVALAYLLIAWVLLQAADFALDLIDAPNWVIQALFMLAALGLPAVLVFSWVFEMTPEGLKREHEVDRTQSITPQTGQKLNRVIIGALTLAVAYLLVDKMVLQDRAVAPAEPVAATTAEPVEEAPAVPDKPSVAVLPFVNMSGSEDNEYFSDGLTETLLHMLAQLPDLQVAARTSSFAFKGQNASVGEIATALGVAHILEGSVQRAGDKVRVTAQLIKADDGFHLWSETYDRDLVDIFAIQDEIATDVASALDASLLGNEHPDLHGVETTDLAAYDLYLKGLQQQAIYSYGSLDEAERHFKQALARDPEFTDARLALVRNYLLKFRTGQIDVTEERRHVEPLLAQIRTSDPDSRLARAYELHLEIYDWSNNTSKDEVMTRIEEQRALLPLIPTDSFIRTENAGALSFFEHYEEALQVLEAGLMLDPLDPAINAQIGGIYLNTDNLEKARVAFEKARDLAPENPNSYGNLAELERQENNLPAALDHLRISAELDPEDHEIQAVIAEILFALELPEEGARWAARAQVLGPGTPITRRIQLEEAFARGETDRAIALAQSMIVDQVPNRYGSFFVAAVTYADLMMREGRSREAYEFLMATRPDIADFSATGLDFQGRVMRQFAIQLMSGFDTFENRQTAWNAHSEAMEATGFDWLDEDSGSLTLDLLINGRTDEAVAQFLEHRLDEPVAQNLYRHRKWMPDMNAPLYADPRVEAALAERSREVAAVRAEVQEMLLQPEWNL
ncbi:hypothetical protein F3N42_08455 [Marinihelvus fidelis]|uniref:Tetratricopeptide repeat protein n=1 Tax=Marinihelvus fidelis TaxID=2613842 RepID=A0A5N0TA61_9GAMM|nr:hypothetical protein [Marinihelvus fidelis]KAA9131344.1 hypothetical protein F3N42_08455 [Marinihelvus fidelis]